MKRLGLVGLLAVLAAVVSLSPAQAQIGSQKWASPNGIGTDCSTASPCPLAHAIIVGGRVNCIEGGLANGLDVPFSTSLIVDCPNGVLTSSFNPGLSLTGTSSQVVILRNLSFDGANSGTGPFIQVSGGATLIIENCRFDSSVNGSAIAVKFLPTSPAAQLIIRDSVFANNGVVPSSGGGLLVAPGAGGSASVSLERVSFNYNVTGMVLSGPVNATMIDSKVQASRSNGILVSSGATLDIKDSTLMYNVGAAVSVSSGGTLRLSNNDIKGNQVGVSNSGGHVFTYSNNAIFGNGTTAALTPIQRNQ